MSNRKARTAEASDIASEAATLGDASEPTGSAADGLVDFPPRDDEPAEEGHTARNGIERKRYSRAPKAPDPFGGHTIQLTPDPEGPKARFLRSNENSAMLIQFDPKPEQETIDYLKSQGFYWERNASSDSGQGAYVIKLEEGKEWRNHAHAERVFAEAINTIREKNGMEAWIPGAAQGAA